MAGLDTARANCLYQKLARRRYADRAPFLARPSIAAAPQQGTHESKLEFTMEMIAGRSLASVAISVAVAVMEMIEVVGRRLGPLPIRYQHEA